MNDMKWNGLDPAAKKVWRVKGLIILVLPFLLIILPLILTWIYTTDAEKEILPWVIAGVSIVLLVSFIIYNIWIIMYYNRYRYALGEEGILVHRGVWWKYKRLIPYARIQHISIDQGPIEQIFGIYRVNSYTAGSGSMGGASAGSSITGPEGQILGVRNPEPLKEEIMKRVMRSRLGDGVSDIKASDLSSEILGELRAIRHLLERK